MVVSYLKNKKAPVCLLKIDTVLRFYHVYGVKCHFVPSENTHGDTFYHVYGVCLIVVYLITELASIALGNEAPLMK